MLLFICSIISLNSFIVTTCKSSDPELFTILVSSSYNVVAFNIITTGALKGIALIPLLYYDLSSEYMTEPCAVNTVRSSNGLGI